MIPTTFRIPPDHAADFLEELTAWSASVGNDPQAVAGVDVFRTTNTVPAVTYQAMIDESFFAAYPQWRQYVAK